jgi:predicted DCC family thiol-disulfide oxidoreductase YuxK
MREVKDISPWQFALFRILFGTYLFAHFFQLLPYAGELFSSAGLLDNPKLNFTFGVLPNPLEHFHSAAFATAFVAALAFLALAFALGLFRRTSALLLWFGWACMFNRNNLILNPGIPYVGLLLVLCALVPPGEPLVFGRRSERAAWQMPALIYWIAWFLLAVGYTYSGWFKLLSPSWLDGTALHHLATNPLARPGLLRDWMLRWPDHLLHTLTWCALAGELLALPLSFHRRTRLVSWLWMLSMHVGILVVVDFADLTLGMIMIHLFTFDPDWLPAREKDSGRQLVLFDGVCALCHRTVQFLLTEDRAARLQFAPLQGAAAQPILRRHQLNEAPLRSLVFVESAGSDLERIHVKSDAVLRALAALGGFWQVVSWLRLVPRPVRDAAYDVIARNRYRWFGTQESCLLPTAGLSARIVS